LKNLDEDLEENDDDPKNKKKNKSSKKKFLDVFSHEPISLEQAQQAIKEHDHALVAPVYDYWLEKRRSRSGNPLVKKFHKNVVFGPRFLSSPSQKKASQKAGPQENLMRMRQLRRDLEKCRILLELIKKRERIKLDLILALRDEFEIECDPVRYGLRKILDAFEE
jgi:hypothetical protein